MKITNQGNLWHEQTFEHSHIANRTYRGRHEARTGGGEQIRDKYRRIRRWQTKAILKLSSVDYKDWSVCHTQYYFTLEQKSDKVMLMVYYSEKHAKRAFHHERSSSLQGNLLCMNTNFSRYVCVCPYFQIQIHLCQTSQHYEIHLTFDAFSMKT